MNMKMTRRVAIGLAIGLIAGVCLIDASGQRRRKRKKHTTPQITNPAIAQPSPSDSQNGSEPRVVGGSEDQPGVSDQTPKRPPAANDDPDSMRRTIRTLSSQVDKLTDKIGQMEEQQRSLVDLERLSRSEQRAEGLRAQLRDVQAKEGELQAHAQDIEYALKPENIERAVAGYGTTHPEEAREQRRKQLEGEKARSQAQLEQLASSRTHLEQAIATADAETERLRERLNAADAAAIQNGTIKVQQASPEAATPTSAPAAAATPSPSPTPPQ
jgi:hypothetical protein